MRMGKGKGKVFLVGAGPGDPRLVTVKGLEAIRQSDAIVYDRLAGPRLLRHARADAEMYYVGKMPDRHTMKQEEINRLLVELALQGKTVTRLKGGDPSVFGRVGEEAEELAKHGVPFEIVPGVTSAIAVPVYAGIPVTHRDLNTSFTVVTGHERPDRIDTQIPWQQLAANQDTIVFLMGVSNIRHICAQLMSHGRPPDTPVALVRWGTRVEQETITGTLSDIADAVERARFQPPAVIIVGEVVRLRDKIQWFEHMPLFGRRVLVTRSRAQTSELADKVDAMGGEAVEFPVIQLSAQSDPRELEAIREAIDHIERYHWILFTSVNGVIYFFQFMKQFRRDIRSLHGARIAAVGPKTREALEDLGFVVEELPSNFQQEGLLELVLGKLRPGERILLPKSAIARSILPDGLRRNGYELTELSVYDNRLVDEGADEAARMLREGEVDVITFTSSSTVRNFFEIMKRYEDDPNRLIGRALTACIGPVTARTAKEVGMKVDIVAGESTIDSLLDAIVSHFRGSSSSD